jgi:tRNA threonylcarbamoyladenosine biosynthesis protein TsaB
MPQMKILAIDTALQAVSACVYESGAGAPEAAETIAMQRGHAEALMPLIDRVMAQVESGFSALGRVAVTVGPGSFTGLRIGISAGRAIGIACGVPVVGVSTLAALAAPLILDEKPGLVAAAIDAGRGNVYFAAFGPEGRAIVVPRVMPVRDAVRLLGAGPIRMAGSGAPMLAIEAWSAHLSAEVVGAFAPDIGFVAKLGLLADPASALPRPLYLQAPDIKVPEAGHVPLAHP